MNFPDRVRLSVKVDTGKKDATGKPIYSIVNTPAPALVVLISAKESQGVFAVTDVSVRVPLGFPALNTIDQIIVDSGPLKGTYNINAIRPNRHHARYIARRAA